MNAIKLKHSSSIMENSSPISKTDEIKIKDLKMRLEGIISEKEPLIISIMSTVYEDLKEIHKHLGAFCAVDPIHEKIRSAQVFLGNLDNFKRKMKEHQDLANTMEEHSKELEIILIDIKDI